MRVYDIIKKKRDGEELSAAEIKYFIEGYAKGEIPDYQAAAFCMAVYFKGMTERETADLTFAIRDSGENPDLSGITGIRADKHSTGGVGDKTSLIVVPAVAACGVKVAKMSGRGLGHTGGTVDKMESVPGVKTELSPAEFVRAVNSCGMAIIAQSDSLAAADKKLYALRDVTATVDSIPLIASSIMGKKLALDDDCIVLDVKTGSGAFMKTLGESEKLARAMVDIGKRAGKRTVALITDMDRPLGRAIGNSLEMKEALGILHGNLSGAEDLYELSVRLAAEMLFLAGKGNNLSECEEKIKNAIIGGEALKTFALSVRTLGGDESYVFNPEKLKISEKTYEIKAEKDGYIVRSDAEGYGTAALMLGAGRNKKDDNIDKGAGIVLLKKTGDKVKKGDIVARMYSSDENKFGEAVGKFNQSTEIGLNPPSDRETVLKRID